MFTVAASGLFDEFAHRMSDRRDDDTVPITEKKFGAASDILLHIIKICRSKLNTL